MRLCRIERGGTIELAFYGEESVVPIAAAAAAAGIDLQASPSLVDHLPGGPLHEPTRQVANWLAEDGSRSSDISVATSDVALRVPVPNPTKLMLLAGNYSKHIEEGGGQAAERAATFPYVFMKPPLTTLTHPGDPIRIPSVSPDHIDWELELGVVIGRECRSVDEDNALEFVAGYTVVNDISDRKFRPNPDRTQREKDGFFDWLHGKWHDTFCPMGPCVLANEAGVDPQQLKLTLRVNGEVEQDGSTAEMVFPVAAIVSFVSSIVTLVPGDIISTGTTSGVGAAKNKFLRSGDSVEAQIESIGVLKNPVE